MTWRVDTPGVDPENHRWFPTEAEADAKRDELKRGGARYVVVWEMGEPLSVSEAAEDARGIAGMPTVALGSIRRPQGPQIEETRSA